MSGGTRLKVLEGMLMSQAVLSRSVGCEVIDVSDGERQLMVDKPRAFAEAARLLTLRPRSVTAWPTDWES
jgi:hypothetical protein